MWENGLAAYSLQKIIAALTHAITYSDSWLFRNNGTTQRPVANYTSNTVQRQRQQSPMSTSKIIDDDDINTMTAYGQYYNSTLGR